MTVFNNGRCEIEEKRINRLEEKYDDLNEKVGEVDKDSSTCIASITKSLELLSVLPDLVSNLSKSVLETQYDVKTLGEKVTDVEKKLDKYDTEDFEENIADKNVKLENKKNRFMLIGVIVAGIFSIASAVIAIIFK